MNSQNKNIAISVTFISESKFKKKIFFSKIAFFFKNLYVHFESLLGWECTYVCHD